MSQFINTALPKGEKVDLIVSGKNGDARLNNYYALVENQLKETPTTYYKHLTGEFPTSSAVALWLASMVLSRTEPLALLKIEVANPIKNILLYNTYKGNQHSFILVSAV